MATTGRGSEDATPGLVERLFAATISTLALASVHLGRRPGFYQSLALDG